MKPLMMNIFEVTSPRLATEFLRVPYIIYKEDRNWIPHLKQDIANTFDREKNKYFEHGEATRWVMKDGKGNLAGRVAAFINNRTAYTFKQPTGGMGFFECVNDRDAAHALFEKCREWLEAGGMKAMDGPINFGEKERFWGLLVQNFSSPPIFRMNHNPPWYRDLFESYGFRAYYEQYVFLRTTKYPLQDKYIERWERIVKNNKYHFETASRKNVNKYMEDFVTIYNSAWVTHDNFRPMTKEQAVALGKKIAPVMDEDLMWFAYHDGKPVGCYLSLPELNEIFRYVGDRLHWWGKLKFLWYKWRRPPRTAFGIAFGIVPEHQGRGIEGAIFNEFGKRILPKKKYDNIIISWIGDFNPKMIRIIENLKAEKYRTLITYRKIFDPDIPFERCPVIE